MKIERQQNYFYKILDEIKAKDKPLVIFGAGGHGKTFFHTFKRYGIEAVYFCDNNELRINSDFQGKKIISFTELKKIKNEVSIFVATEYPENIIEQLETNGFKDIFTYHLLLDIGLCFYPVEFSYYDFFIANQALFQQAYNFLEDEASRRTFEALINFNISRNTKIMEAFYVEEQYYHPAFQFHDSEVFVDCGAYSGDTVEQFIEKTNGIYSKIFAFEPDEMNFELAKDNLKSYENVQLYKAGIWSHNTEVGFMKRGNMFSRIEMLKNTAEKVKLFCLDEALHGEKCTFIKMDIQGSEIEALKGAKEIIQKYSPKLAICCYHKLTDLFQIPIKIKEIDPEYKIYIVNHSMTNYETVCYAFKGENNDIS